MGTEHIDGLKITLRGIIGGWQARAELDVVNGFATEQLGVSPVQAVVAAVERAQILAERMAAVHAQEPKGARQGGHVEAAERPEPGGVTVDLELGVCADCKHARMSHGIGGASTVCLGAPGYGCSCRGFRPLVDGTPDV